MDEQQFKKIMIQVRALAKSQGETISREQVRDKFLPLGISEDQLMLIYKYLDEENVTLYASEKERKSASSEPEKKSGSKSRIMDTTRTDPDDEEYDPDSEYLKMYINDLDSLYIPEREERSNIIKDLLSDRDTLLENLPNLYLREVIDIARLYEGQGVALEDLIGEGNIAVMSGIKMLDCCDTVEEVEEFIVKMIMDSMESLIMDNFSEDEFDLKVVERVNELSDKAKEMAEEMERLVTVEELVNELEQDEDYVRETIRLSGNAIPYIEGCKETDS